MKIKEFRAGQEVEVVHRIHDSRSGSIPPGKMGRVVKIVDGYAPTEMDEYEYAPHGMPYLYSPRDGRGHTQLVRVRFSRKRIETVSGWYLRNKRIRKDY